MRSAPSKVFQTHVGGLERKGQKLLPSTKNKSFSGQDDRSGSQGLVSCAAGVVTVSRVRLMTTIPCRRVRMRMR